MAKAEKDFRRLFGRILTVGGMIIIAVVIIMLMNGEGTEAATINVPADQPTITDAIINATDWDIINVTADTYNEDLKINKSLTIQGADWSNTFINGEHVITANDVYLNSFTLNNSATYLITIDASTTPISNVEINYCVFNLIGYSGVHIGGDLGSGNLISNISINYNTFNGPPTMWSNPFKIGGFFGSPASQPIFNMDFVGNNINNGSIPINLHNTNINDILIDGNTFRNTDGIVYVWGGGTPTGVLSNFVFTNNDVDFTNSYGVGIGYPDGTFTPSNFGDGNKINYNSFDNIPGAYGMGAVSNFMGTPIDASKNWWGDSSGSDGEGPGTGSSVSTNVEYSPWWRIDYRGDVHLTPWIWGLDGGLQHAIDTALSKDILVVNAGTYSENIAVNKIITIIDSSFTLNGNAAVLGTSSLYLVNTSMTLDVLNVLNGGIFGYYDSGSTLYVGEQNIYGKVEWWEARVVSGDITVHDGGILFINSSSVEMNCSFDGEFEIQVNTSGTLITMDNGTGRSEITAYNTSNCYFFNVYGTLTSSDTDITYGWELYINSPNAITIGNSVLIQSMEANGIHVSGSKNVWINNSWIVGNSWDGMLMDSSSVINATGSIFNLNGQNGVTLDSDSTFSATTCTFNNNLGGSGAVVMGASNFSTTACTFNNNIGGSGAVIFGSSSFTADTCNFNGNNNLGFAANSGTVSLTNCTLSGNGQAGLYTDSSTITLNSDALINNLGGFDVYCINSTIYSTDDTFGHMMLIGCTFVRYTGTFPVSISGCWIFFNCTGPNSITFQNNVTVLPPGVMILGNTTLIMDSVTPGMTVALDIFGTLQAQFWDNNPNNIQGVNDVAYYLRAHSGSSFNLTSTYLENVGVSSSDLHETGIWINTNNFLIQNNVIWNNNNGLVFQGISSLASIVSQNVIVGNSASGVYVESSAITLSNNFIDNNNNYGIYWHDSFVTPSLNQNTISNNMWGGILLDADFDAVITQGDMSQNNVQLNDIFGLNITAGRDINCQLLAYDSNIVDSNLGDGIILYAQRNIDATITADVTNNSDEGYDIFACMRVRVTVFNSLIQNNQGYGIALKTANLGIRAYILNNSLANNRDGAISIDSGGAGSYIEIRGNNIEGNGGAGTPAISLSDVTADISDNSIINSGGDGIYCRYSDVSINSNQITLSIVNGIYLSYSPAVVSGNTIRSNNGGGIYVEYSMPTISNNVIESNDEGIILFSSDGIISGNTIVSNNQDGIHLMDSNPMITGNMILSNLGNGIYADQSAPIISGNTIMGSLSYGIYLDQSAGLIEGNIISDNNLGGVYSYYSNPEIRNNTILGNINYGIHINYYSSPIIEDNTITNNAHGVYVEDFSSPTITNNKINTNLNNGIYIYFYSSAIISYNTVNNNGLTGIYIVDSTAHISENTIMSNDDYGIYTNALTDYVMVTIENNVLSGNYNTNIYFDASGYEMSATIANNIMENSIFGYGLEATGNFLFTMAIENNVIRNNNYDAIYLENYGDSIITSIVNNTISNNLYGYGIEMYCVYDVFATINNNQIISPYYDGVNIDSSVDINLILKGNTINNSANGYGVYLSATNTVSADIMDNDISGNYYSNFYSTSQDGYLTMTGNDLSNSINEYGMQIFSVFDMYLDMIRNTVTNNYDDNIYVDVSSNWDPADITIQNNDISGSIWGNGIDIDVEYDIIALVEGNDLSGNRYHNLDIFTTWGIIDAYITNNDLGSGSILGKGIYLQAQFDVYAVIINNDITGNYEENIYIRSFSGNGYLTITDNIITNSASRQGIYVYTYNDQIATIKNNDISGNYLSNVHLETMLNEFGDISTMIIGNNFNNSYYGYGLYIYTDDTIYNTMINNNMISGCDIDGIHLETNYYNWENVEITNNYITLSNNMGIYGVAGYEIYNLDISNNFIVDNLNNGLYLRNDYLVESVTLSSNTVIRNDGDGIYLFFGDNLQVGCEFSNNIITNNDGYGVYFREDLGGILGPATFTDNQISNNLLGGLYFYVNTFCNILVVSDNTFENNGQDAIYIHVDSMYMNSLQIFRNTISSNDGYGIFTRGDAEVYLIQINDNVVSSSSNTGIHLQLNGIVEAIEVSRNSITSSSIDGIYLYSLDSVDNLIMNDNELININDEAVKITISGSSENIQITRNIIDNSGYGCIDLDISDSNAIQINDNVMTNCADYGVILNTQSGIYSLQIKGNTLSNLNNSAIYIYTGTDINTLQIMENTIDNIAVGYGIYLSTNSAIGSAMVCDNSVKNTYRDGIYLNIFSDLTILLMNDNDVTNCISSNYAGISLIVGNGISSGEFLRNKVTNVAQGILGYGIYMNVFGNAGQWSMNYNIVNQTYSGGIYFEIGYADIVRFNDNKIFNTGNFGIELITDSISNSISGFEFNRNTIVDTENGVYLYFAYEVYLVQINDNTLKNVAQSYGLYLVNMYNLDLLEFSGNIVDNTRSGIRFNMNHAPETITISENIISDTIWDYGIRLEISNTSGYVSNLVICNNQITNTNFGILMGIYCDVYTAQINNNIIMNSALEHALYLVFYDWVGLYEMNDNYIDNSDKGVYLHFGLGVDEIIMNTNEISEVVNGYGLYLWAGANAVTSLQFNDNIVYNTARGVYMFFGDGIYTAQIEGSIITNVARDHGLFLESNDYVYLIRVNNNIIQNVYKNGLYLYLYGTNTSQVNDNTIINCGENGMTFYSSQSVYTAEFNRNNIGNARYGAFLNFNNNLNLLQFKGNVIKNINTFYGLYFLVSGITYDVQIVSNNITNTNFEGMYLDFSTGPDTFQFNSNMIMNSASRGLYLSSGTSIKVFTVENNRITNNDGTGAHIQSSFGLTLKIENNNFSYNYGTNLYVRSVSGNIAATITNNIILNSMGGEGLELRAGGELSADIENNQISNNYDKNLYIQSLGSGYLTVSNNDLSNSIWDYGMWLEASNSIVASIDENEASNNYYSNVFITCDSGYITVFNNAFSGSISASGLEILANLDLDVDLKNNMILNNWDSNIDVFVSGPAQLILTKNELLNADFGVQVTSGDLNAIIENNDIRNNHLGNIYLDSSGDLFSTVSNNNLTGAFSGDGIYVDSGGTLGGTISENNVRFNYNGLYLDVLASGDVLDIYGNTISENLMFGLYANGGITGSFNDNTFFSNYIAVMIENIETPYLTGNLFSYNIYDIQLINSNTSINSNRFDNTTEICIQTLDSWPTIAKNHFENIGHELRYPPAKLQMVMSIRFSSGNMKYNPIPVSIVFNVIDDSLAESINVMNGSVAVNGCTFGYSPYSSLYATNSILWVNDSTLLSAIKIEDLETIVYIIDSEFDSDLVEFPKGDGTLVVGYTTDVKVLDQFGEAQANLKINISSPNGWYTNGYTNTKGYFNGSVTTAYTQTALGKDYSMNPYNITVRDGASLLFSLSFDVHGSSLKIIVLNDAPSLSLPSTINFNEDTQFRFNLDDYTYDDGGLENLAFTYSGGTNITVTIEDNSIVTLSAQVNWWGGPESITFRATDTLGLFTENTVNVSVVSVNDQPKRVAYLPDATFNEDGKLNNAFDLDTYFEDVDSVLTYDVISTSNISINLEPVNNTVSFSAIANWCGIEYITFTASDGEFLLSDIIQVTVNSINDAPRITSIATAIAIESQQYTYDVDAMDGDEEYGDVLGYALTTAPTGMVIDPVIGKITWTPSYEQALIGNFDITVVVTDSFGAFDTQSFVVDVNVDNEPPSISDIGITPLYPMEGDIIFAVPINWSDDQTPAAQAKYFYQWYKNGDPIYSATDSSLSSDHFVKGDIIVVEVMPFDGGKYGNVVVSRSVLIQNSPPSITNVVISPQHPTEIDDLTAFPIGFNDPDASDETEMYTYSWERDGIIISGVVENTLNAAYFQVGDVITVTVIPSDGEDNGPSRSSKDITILMDPTDSDGDGIPDREDHHYIQRLDEDVDTSFDFDNDGVPDSNDVFPYDKFEWSDIDGDGEGDNTDHDKDGDGVPNDKDEFIFDSAEWKDSDHDDIGDNADSDDDNDLTPDINDAFPNDPYESRDLDGDGKGDNKDEDIDGDGVLNNEDDFPYNPLEQEDTDGDGIGNNADIDDDGDGVSDEKDYYPLDKTRSLDPLWWWWIVIALLLLILMIMVFLSRRKPGYEELPGDEFFLEEPPMLKRRKVVLKEKEKEPKKARVSESKRRPRKPIRKEPEVEETFEDEAEEFEEEEPGEFEEEFEEKEAKDYEGATEKKSKEDIIGEMLAEAESEVKELGFLGEGKDKVYSDEELKVMGKDELTRVAESMGLSISGTRFAILSRIIEARRPADESTGEEEEEAGDEVEQEIECPSCGKTFTQKITERPARIECPHCGVTGMIN